MFPYAPEVERIKFLLEELSSMEYAVREIIEKDHPELVKLIARFRVALAAVRGKDRDPDLADAKDELATYLEKVFPIYIAETKTGDLVGYLVCRVDGEVVWAESLYVDPAWRRQGVGSRLFAKAEEFAQALGGEWPYNWVDPENQAIIHFLGQHGYDVLNLVELRKPEEGEILTQRVRVGSHQFRR